MTEYRNEGVNHPKHYNHPSGYDIIEWIDRFSCGFAVGNCAKYMFRAGNKNGESADKDHEKVKWYFKHEAEKIFKNNNMMLTWEDSKKKVFEQLQKVFGPPEKNRATGEINWEKGGCDMPECISWLNENCMTMLLE